MGPRRQAQDSWTTAGTFSEDCDMFGQGEGYSLWLKTVFLRRSQTSLPGIKSMRTEQSGPNKLKQHGHQPATFLKTVFVLF